MMSSPPPNATHNSVGSGQYSVGSGDRGHDRAAQHRNHQVQVAQLVADLAEMGRPKGTWHGFSAVQPMPPPAEDSFTSGPNFRREGFDSLLQYWQNTCNHLVKQIKHMDGAYKAEIPKWIKRETELNREISHLTNIQENTDNLKAQLLERNKKLQDESENRWGEICRLRLANEGLKNELQEARHEGPYKLSEPPQTEPVVIDHAACHKEIDSLSVKKAELEERVIAMNKVINTKFATGTNARKQIKELRLKIEEQKVVMEVLAHQIDLLVTAEPKTHKDYNKIRTLYATTHVGMETGIARDHEVVRHKGKLRDIIRELSDTDDRWLLTRKKIIRFWREQKNSGHSKLKTRRKE